MIEIHEDKYKNELRGDCEKCFGLCCIALYFSASEGFPTNKEGGQPCINLEGGFTCKVHKSLRKKGYNGCTVYDCFGAGQKVSQITFGGHSWRERPETADRIFDSFLVMRQLQEMVWYLNQAFDIEMDIAIKEKIGVLIEETEKLTNLDEDSLLKVDIVVHRNKVNLILKATSETIRSKGSSKMKNKDFFGKDLRKINLRGGDLRGACLIAANLIGMDLSFADFIGADLRDADIRGADLRKSIFLTQIQINSAKGDSKTKLPKGITPPSYWEK